MITMYPLDFEEFLMALDCEKLIDLIKNSYTNNTTIDNPIHMMILDYYYKYLAIGGMPATANAYITKKDFDFVRIAQNDIQGSYYGDMTKYIDVKESNKILATYRSIPSQLAK